MIQIAPSLLSADFSRLEQEAADVAAGGANLLHLDVMDGHFVPNITFGPCVVSSLRAKTRLFFDVHFMLCDPLSYVSPFAKAGADMITFHYESGADIQKTIDAIKSAGIKVGMAVKPGTDAAVLEPFLRTAFYAADAAEGRISAPVGEKKPPAAVDSGGRRH